MHNCWDAFIWKTWIYLLLYASKTNMLRSFLNPFIADLDQLKENCMGDFPICCTVHGLCRTSNQILYRNTLFCYVSCFKFCIFLCIHVVWAGIDSVMNGSHIRCSIRHGVATNQRFCLLLCNDSLTMPDHYCCMNLFTEIESHQLNYLHTRKTTTSSLKPGW